jgi:hypothetical protein
MTSARAGRAEAPAFKEGSILLSSFIQIAEVFAARSNGERSFIHERYV